MTKNPQSKIADKGKKSRIGNTTTDLIKKGERRKAIRQNIEAERKMDEAEAKASAKKQAAKRATPKVKTTTSPKPTGKAEKAKSAPKVKKERAPRKPCPPDRCSQYTPLSSKDSQNAKTFFSIIGKAPKKSEKGSDGKTRRVIADTNMRIMAKQVIRNIQTLQKNAKDGQSPNKAASDNLQSFVTLYS